MHDYDSDDSEPTREEKIAQKMDQRYLRLMSDNKWQSDLERMGKNLENLKVREKVMK